MGRTVRLMASIANIADVMTVASSIKRHGQSLRQPLAGNVLAVDDATRRFG
jgi:hypothetical protein